MDQIAKISPTYTEIIKKMAQFLKDKKWSLFKRTLLIVWPFFIFFFYFPVFELLHKGEEVTSESPSFFMFIGGILLLGGFATLYAYLMRQVFFIEKVIWIDSFFDQKEISDAESFRIARKLFIPVIKMKVLLFLNYYLIGFIFYFGVLAGIISAIPYVGEGLLGETTAVALIAQLLLGPVLVWIYYYYLDIKLRYFWMIYLDRYGSDDFSYKNIKLEMFRLNEISKSASYKKIIIMNFGIASVSAITKGIIESLTSFLEGLGSFGIAAGNSLDMFIEEYFNQAASMGKTFTKYVLYKHARAVLYDEEQIVNTSLYSIGEKDA
jgi:hypothetical protein